MSNPKYKNAFRSKRLIKEAFLELAQEHDIAKIKVADIIRMTDLSKGTFYLHYQDIFAVLREIENECITNIQKFLTEQPVDILIDDILPFLDKLFGIMDENQDFYCRLFSSKVSLGFLEKLQEVFVDIMMSNKELLKKLKDEKIARLFFTFIAVGTASLVQQHYSNKTDISTEELKTSLNDCILHGMTALKK
ncbi:MAG: TetR/AcrR family transcriptional regulator [Spirochaetales bacterium]